MIALLQIRAVIPNETRIMSTSSVIYSSAYEILAFLISFLVAFFLLATVSVFASSVVSSFKISISALISLVLAVVVLISALPGEVMAEKFPYLFEQALFQDGFLQERGVLSDISLKIWGANRWLGGGLGTFPLELKFAATENEYHSISLMQACPLNGYWHLICENGIIGVSIYTGILLLGFIALLYRVVKAVVNSVKSIEDDPTVSACMNGRKIDGYDFKNSVFHSAVFCGHPSLCFRIREQFINES